MKGEFCICNSVCVINLIENYVLTNNQDTFNQLHIFNNQKKATLKNR